MRHLQIWKLPRSLHCSDAIIKTVGRWPPTRRQRPSDVWLRERTHTSSCSPEIYSNIAKCPVNDSKYDAGRQHFQGMQLHRDTLCSSQLKGFSKESFWQVNAVTRQTRRQYNPTISRVTILHQSGFSYCTNWRWHPQDSLIDDVIYAKLKTWLFCNLEGGT